MFYSSHTLPKATHSPQPQPARQLPQLQPARRLILAFLWQITITRIMSFDFEHQIDFPQPSTSPNFDAMSSDATLNVWCFLDGKPGHQNQTLGLVDALQRCATCKLEPREIVVPTTFPARFFGYSPRTLPNSPQPHLLVGAGHATHIPILRARRRFGGRSIVLMKPSLPLSFFDLCVVPDSHSLPSSSQHVLLTRGVLNRIQYSHNQDPDQATILVGGPSQHFDWSDDEVLNQMAPVILNHPNIRWTVATSRRTPQSFIHSFHTKNFPAQLVSPDAVSRDWLPQQIQSSHTIWVTEDSVSMTYEAVTSGATVGTFQLNRPRCTRVTKGMDRLVETGFVTPFSRWSSTGQLTKGQLQLGEADRVAQEILCRFCPQLACQQTSAGSLL